MLDDFKMERYRALTSCIVAAAGNRDNLSADGIALLWNVVLRDVLSSSEGCEGGEEGNLLDEHIAIG